ncbi:MAG: hypothetical protein KF768_04425 [Phycisphaeraceae bacterium]|nr:hypothetical protein [Phycisphaeraceae bacterium]
MSKVLRYGVIALVLVVFVAAMATYTVRFNETAVVSTFGDADETSVKTEAGLRFMIPFVQRVTKYDKRARYVESNPETQQTRDARQLIVAAGLTWRVSDPLRFYKSTSGRGTTAAEHFAFAEDLLKSRVRTAMSELSQFRLEQLLSASSEGSQLPVLEDRMLASLTGSGAGGESLASYGIEPLSVGIVSIALPQDTTRKIFDGMNTSRQRLANELVSQGKSQAATIRSTAEADATKIRKFAERLAEELRRQGDLEATEFLKQTVDAPELAMFLGQMDFIRSSFGRSTTLVLPTSMPGLEWLRPDALERAGTRNWRLPTFDVAPVKSADRSRAEGDGRSDEEAQQ